MFSARVCAVLRCVAGIDGRYRKLQVGLERVSWLILEASFTIACAETAARLQSNSGSKSKATGNPFERVVGPKIASDSAQVRACAIAAADNNVPDNNSSEW